MTIYMDYNAGAPMRPQACAAMAEAMLICGNPSSPHHAGRKARFALEQARASIADFCGADPSCVIFTSSGTEANAQILRFGLSDKAQWLISAVEHASIAKNAPEDKMIIPVNHHGLIDIEIFAHQLDQIVASGKKPYVSVIYANNETGVIQDLDAITALVKARDGFIHCDCVQAAGKLPLNIKRLGVDALSLSAHKMGGPAGIGALVLARDIAHDTKWHALLKGGGQEFGYRAGTENLVAICGFAAIAQYDKDFAKLALWRDQIERALPKQAVIFGANAPRLANTSCFAFPPLSSEQALILFDLEGVALSAGAACSSGKIGVSDVLRAQAIKPDLARSALRVSLGWQTKKSDIDDFIKILHQIDYQKAA